MTASALGAAPTRISRDDAVGAGVDARDLVGEALGDPDRPVPDGDRAGPGAGRDRVATTLSSSIFETTSLPVSLTQVAPAPTAIALTLSTPLISTGCRVPVVSKRVTAPYWPTHSEDASTASGCGVSTLCSAPGRYTLTGVRLRDRFDRRITLRHPRVDSGDQQRVARGGHVGDRPTRREGAGRLSRAGVDPGDRAVVEVCHPHRSGRLGQRPGSRADRDGGEQPATARVDHRHGVGRDVARALRRRGRAARSPRPRRRRGRASPPTTAARRRRRPRGIAAGVGRWPGRGRGLSAGSCLRIASCSSRSAGLGSIPSSSTSSPARLAVQLKRLGFAPAAIQGEHPRRAQALAQRMLGRQRLELGDQRGVTAEREIGVDADLQRLQAQLL